MKIFLLIIIGLTIFYLSYLFSRHYVKQLEIYKELIKFCEILSSQINFKQNSLKTIVSEHLYLFASELKHMLNNYFVLNNKSVTSIYLNGKDINQITQFFNSLGKLDVQGEINNIQNFKVIFNACASDKNETNKKFGSMVPKLGALLGLLVFIIFM